MKTIELDGHGLTIEMVAGSAFASGTDVRLSEEAVARMRASRAVVDRAVENQAVVYGVTTGFGEFANVSIPPDKLGELQANLIRSHAVGTGEEMPAEIVRSMMVLRINALARGHSGIRVETVESLIAMLRADILPMIPTQGSVGSSGDLVPLAHLVLGLMGEGECTVGGERHSASSALADAGVTPVRLAAKEGLALINGTQMMTAYGSLALSRMRQLLIAADVIGVMSVEALKGTDRAYDARLHDARPHAGQILVAQNLRRLMQDSPLRESHREDDDRVQDAYSLRCIPQVHGASRTAFEHVRSILEVEINSATDNPLIFSGEGEVVEGGNFHGQPVAVALDYLAIASAEIANISERRTERMVNGALSRLPRFLTTQGGLNSGLMIAQYTAAAIVSENKVLSHPASVDSIPTSANQEDHNSMGSISARKVFQIAENVSSVLAVELLCACQGLDYHSPTSPGPYIRKVHELVRESIPHLEGDRALYEDLRKAKTIVNSSAIEEIVGSLLGEQRLA